MKSNKPCTCHICKKKREIIDLTPAITPDEVWAELIDEEPEGLSGTKATVTGGENKNIIPVPDWDISRIPAMPPAYRVDEWSKPFQQWIAFCPEKTIEGAIMAGNNLVASGISARVVNLKTGETPWEVSNL